MAVTDLLARRATLARSVRLLSSFRFEQSDPDLDQDIADWFSTDCDRPRLTLLGPVAARTHGKALAKRKPYRSEEQIGRAHV